MKTCKTCKHWEQKFGGYILCKKVKVSLDRANDGSLGWTRIFIGKRSSKTWHALCPIGFGCIYHEEAKK